MNLLTIFVFVLIIVLIYVVYKLMTKTTSAVSGFSDASKSLMVPCSKSSGIATTNNFGYSAWLYIDSWVSNASGATINKNMLTRCNSDNVPMFQLYLDNEQNNMNLVIQANAPCTIVNVQLQKWINITMSVYGNTTDLYLDGKLVRTSIMTVLPPALASSDNLYIGGSYDATTNTFADGDLQGYISNVIYKADYFTPEEAWSIYSDGYSGAGMFNFINSYKLIFSVTKDNETVGQVSI